LQWEKLIIIKEFGVLKFKYIHGFNVAMFGKQWWILVFSPYELISHVLKVRYYPNEGFLEAQVGYNPRYYWRSIQSSEVVIKEEFCWCIRSGAGVRLWKEIK